MLLSILNAVNLWSNKNISVKHFATETKYELLQWDNVPEEIRQAPVQKIIFKNAR